MDHYDGSLVVGYLDIYKEDVRGDDYVDEFDRAGVAFDLSSLAGHQIAKATLDLAPNIESAHDIDRSECAEYSVVTADFLCIKRFDSYAGYANDSCVTYLDLGTDRWWQNNDLQNSINYLKPAGDLSIDVTNIVAKWALLPTSNFGFIMRGDDENDTWHGKNQHVCRTMFLNPQLDVSYY